uniref:7TM GPCR serpentine receptor class x (Srx) domain-containing protein n=1 Tax=Panagrolaimus sp. JU765 TaxID=591449 RepID=A0AC34QZF2_9BILA
MFLMHAFPFTVGLILYNKNNCLFDLYRQDCDPIRQFADIVITVINGINNALSLLVIFIGIIIYRTNVLKSDATKNNRIEKLLFFQTFSFAFLNTIVFVCYSVTYWDNGTLYFIVTVLGNYIYFFHEYPPMIILFYASYSFRQNYMSFYGFGKLCGTKMKKWDGSPMKTLDENNAKHLTI